MEAKDRVMYMWEQKPSQQEGSRSLSGEAETQSVQQLGQKIQLQTGVNSGFLQKHTDSLLQACQ